MWGYKWLGKKGVRGQEAGAGRLGATKLGAVGKRAWGRRSRLALNSTKLEHALKNKNVSMFCTLPPC